MWKRLLPIVLAMTVIFSVGSGEYCGSAPEYEIWFDEVEASQKALRPHWSSDGQAIIFRGLPQDALQSTESWGDGNIYRVGLDGSSLKKIAEEAYWLDVSRAGDRILFTTAPHEKAEFRVDSARQDGSGRRQLTDVGRYPIRAALSPDGTRLAWVAGRGVSIMDVDGSDTQKFPVFDTIEAHYSERAIQLHFKSDRPVWSPDGRTLAFVVSVRTGDRPDFSFADVLYTYRIDNLELREVFKSESRGVHPVIFEPAWSPDGQRLAFVQAPDWREAVLHAMHADGSELRPLARELNQQGLTVRADVLTWSPDGSEILFEMRNLQDKNLHPIYVAEVESGKYRKLTSGLGASWSPDGSRIAVIGTDFFPDDETPVYGVGPCGVGDDEIAPGRPYLYTMAHDGSDVRALVWRGANGDLEEANPRSFWPWADWESC